MTEITKILNYTIVNGLGPIKPEICSGSVSMRDGPMEERDITSNKAWSLKEKNTCDHLCDAQGVVAIAIGHIKYKLSLFANTQDIAFRSVY